MSKRSRESDMAHTEDYIDDVTFLVATAAHLKESATGMLALAAKGLLAQARRGL